MGLVAQEGEADMKTSPTQIDPASSTGDGSSKPPERDSSLELESRSWLAEDWEDYLKSLEGGLKESQLPLRDGDESNLTTSVFEITSNSATDQQSSQVEQILVGLTEKQSHVIRAIYWQGLSERNIARLMGISRTAVRKIKSRALKKLKLGNPGTVPVFPIVGAQAQPNQSEDQGADHGE